MRRTYIIISTAIWLLLPFIGNAQSVTVEELSDAVSKGTHKLAMGMNTNSRDSINEAAVYYDKYIVSLRNPSTASVAENAYNPFDVLRWQALAYNMLSDNKEYEFSRYIRKYYVGKGRKDFYSYYSAQEQAFKYFWQQKNAASADTLANDLYNEAVSHNEKSMLMALCEYFKAIAYVLNGDQTACLQWLEKAYNTGRKYEEKERGTYSYEGYLDILYQLSCGYSAKGNYEKALATFDELEEDVKLVYKDNSMRYLQVLLGKPDLLLVMGRIKDMSSTLDKIDSICNVVQGASPDYISQIHNYVASSKQRIKSTLEGQPYTDQSAKGVIPNLNPYATKEEALSVLKQFENTPGLTITYYNVGLQGMVQTLIGAQSYSTAKDILDEGSSYIKSHFNFDGNTLRTVETLYGMLYYSLHDVKGSLMHLNLAKRMFENSGDYGFQYMITLAYLCDSYLANGDIAYTKLILDKLNTEIQKMVGSAAVAENANAETILVTLASAYAIIGYTDKAKEELVSLLQKYGNGDGGAFWDTARKIMAYVYLNDKELDKSTDMLKRTYEISYNNAERILALQNLVMCYAKLHNIDAISYLKRFNADSHSTIIDVMKSFQPGERQIYWNSMSDALSFNNNIVLDAFPLEKEARTEAYDNAIYVNSMQDKSVHDCATWQNVKDMLSDNEVAIEFVNSPSTSADEYHYGALVLRHNDATPQYVDLCPTQEIDLTFQSVIHTDMDVINRLYALGNDTLYRLLWQKIEPLLKEGETVFYSPVSFLCKINMGAISDGKDRLNYKYNLRQVYSTAQIGDVKHRHWKLQGKAVVYGGLIYDESAIEMAEAAKPYQNLPVLQNASRDMAKRSLLGDGTTRSAIGGLTGTMKEAEYIESTFSGLGIKVKLLTDMAGNEESVKALSGDAPQLLHIGTHGYMMSTMQDINSHRSLVEQMGLKENTQREHMLLYSGLLMAGSEQAWRGKPVPDNVEDGILSAYEVSQLDLSKCNLVVLSACETGLGFNSTYGRSIGLETAFKLAGVKSVMASLWEVPDDATSLLMRSFYSALAKGDYPQTALVKAQAEVAKQYPQPYYWAGFSIME